MNPFPTWLNNWRAVVPTTEAIPLDEDQLDFSHIPVKDRWTYRLQHLSKQGFIGWLQEREPSLRLNDLNSGFDSESTLAILLQVSEFRVCLIPTSLSEDEIAIPKAVVEKAGGAAHFYVAVAIDEEAEFASLTGFLPYDKLITLCEHISPDIDETYPLPTDELDFDLNSLLLFLQCLSPSAITLPDRSTSELPSLTSLVKAIDQPIANACVWLQQQANNFLSDDRQVGWQPIPAIAMRIVSSPIREQLTEVLRFCKIPAFPAEAGKAYQLITLAGCTLRLFGIAWPLSDTNGEWMLLTILCPAPGQAFPPALSLAIDEITPGYGRIKLASETLAANNPRAALFAQVKGERDDVFDIILTVGDSKQRWSTAIQFQPEA